MVSYRISQPINPGLTVSEFVRLLMDLFVGGLICRGGGLYAGQKRQLRGQTS